MTEFKGCISNTNLIEYVNKETQINSKLINGFKPILQDKYGGTNDCTICSITAIQSYRENYKRSFQLLYNLIEKTAKNYCYNSESFGTIPFTIKNIINKTFNVKSQVRYLKGIGYNCNIIKNNIQNNIPMVLSLWNDGRNYYKNHSVIIVGFNEFKTKKILTVYDNWHETLSYIDYDKLSRISCINYF